MVPIHGSVTYGDRALEYGSVMFQPVGGGPIARGKIEADGSFELTTKVTGDGATIGEHRVRVTAFAAQAAKAPPAAASDAEPTLGKSAIPRKFNSFATSDLKVHVSKEMTLPVRLRLED